MMIGTISRQRTVDWRLKFERIRQFDSLASAEKCIYYP
jgi:hypothetical protein